MIDIPSLIAGAKEKYPQIYMDMDDEQIYKSIRNDYPDLEWPDNSPFDLQREVNPNKETIDASNKDYSPGIFSKISLAGLPEIWADKHDWAKNAYNNSMAGLIYQTIHGRPKYQVEDYEAPIWEDAASFFMGLVSIPDIALFLGTGGLGAAAGKKIGEKTVVKSIQNAMNKSTTAKVRDKLFAQKIIAEKSLESGFSLGTYGAAGGAIAEAARQSGEGIEDFDYGKIVGESAKAFVSSSIIGAASGGVAKGIMSPKFAKAAMAAKAGNNSFKNVSTRLLNNPLAQVGAEATLFTTGQLTEGALLHSEDITMDKFWRGMFTNTGIVGGMRASTKIFRQGQNDMSRYKKAKLKSLRDIREKQGRSLESVKLELEAAGLDVPIELKDQIIASNLKTQEQEGFFRWTKNQEKDLFHLMEDKEFKNLTPEQQGKAIQGWVALNNIYIDMYDTLIKDKPLRDMIIQSETGLIPNEAQSKAQRGKYEALLEKHKQISKFNSEFGLGDNKKGNKTVAKIAEKEGGVKVDTETPSPKLTTSKDVIKEAQAAGVPQDVIESYRGKANQYLIELNPEGYDLAGLQSVTKQWQAKGSSRIITEGNKLATLSEKPEGMSTDKWDANVKLRNKKGDFELLSDNNRDTILFTSNELLGGVKGKANAINRAVDFAKWLEKKHPEANLASEGGLLSTFYTEYVESISRKMKADGKSQKQINNKVNGINTGLRTFYKNLYTRLADKIPPIPEGKLATPKTQKRSVFVGELGVEESRNPELLKLSSAYKGDGKGGDVIISGGGKPFVAKTKKGKPTKKAGTETIVKRDMVATILDLATILRPRANEFTNTPVKNIDWVGKKISLIRNKTGAIDIIKFDPSVEKFLRKHIKKYNLGTEDLLFFAENKKTGKRSPIEGDHIKYLIKDAIDKSGVDVKVYDPVSGLLSLKTPEGLKAAKSLPLSRIFRTFQEQQADAEGGTLSPLGHTKGSQAPASYNVGEKTGVRTAGTLERDTLAPEGKVTPASAEQVKRRNKWASEKYPEIEVKLVDKLKSTADGREVLGELVQHTARIVKGKAPADAIPHEIVHHAFNVLEAVGTPEAKKLMNQSIKAFNSKEEAVIRIGELVSGRLEKGLIPKAKSWVKRFNIFLKNLFGTPLKTKDADFLLAEMVYKRKDIPTQVSAKTLMGERETMVAPIKEKYGTPEEFRKVVRRNFEVATEHLESKDKRDLTSYILREVLGVPQEKFKQLIYKTKQKITPELEAEYFEHLANFNTVIETSGVEKLRRMKDVTTFFKTVRKIENIQDGERIIRNIKEAEQINMLKSLGVKEGDIWKASQDQLNDYLHMLHKLAVKEPTEPSYIAEQRDAALSKRKELTKFQQILKQVEGMTLPVVDVIHSLGFKKLATRLKDHVAQESHHYGEGHQLMNYDVLNGFTRKTKGGKTIEVVEPISGTTIFSKKRNYEKLREHVSVVDHSGEMYLDAIKWIKDKSLPAKEIKKLQAEIDFFEKAIKPEWKKTIKKDGLKGDALNVMDANKKFKYIDIKTDEGKIVARYTDPVIGMPVYYKNAYYTALKANMNDAQFEAYLKQGDIKWIEKGIYINRSVTNKFKNVVNLEGVAFEKLIENQVTKIAMEEARKHYNVLTPSVGQIAEFREFARGIAVGNIADQNSFSFNKFSTKFLMRRHEKLPMFIKDNDGNWIRTYENTFDGTLKKYAVGMSKYIAGVEVFPEFGKIPGAKIPGAKVEIQELKTMNRGKEWADYVQNAVDHQLGIGKSSPFNMSISALQEYANVLAKTQLSNPLSGVKNAFLATTQAMWAYDALDIGKAMANVYRQENQIYVTKTGAKHLGVRHYEGGAISKLMDKTLFSWGLMRPTEGWARSFSVLTGKIDQKKNIEFLRTNPKGSKLYNKAKKRLELFYELPESDIKILEKYGYGHGKKLDGFTFESKFEKSKMERKLETIHERMNSMAHIKTQGASIALFMPSFASKSAIKPLTLYKRMAYAATVNTTKNVSEAVKSKNYMRLASGTLATYFTGQALLGLYSELLGAPIPKENSGWFDSFRVALWRGEFLGLLSEYLSPFGESAYMTLYPSLIENASTLVMNIQQVAEGKKHVWGKKQAVDSYLRSLVSAYNASMHVMERRNNPYNRKVVQYNQLYKDFEKEIYPNKPNMDFEATTKTPYYIMLQNSFTKGSAKEFSKAFILTYYALASDYYNKGFEMNGVRHYSMKMAYKKANETLKKKIKALNPNRGRPAPKSKTQTKAKYYSWLKWLGKDENKNYLQGLEQVENDYKNRLNDFKKQLPYFIRTNNLHDLKNEFDWIHSF